MRVLVLAPIVIDGVQHNHGSIIDVDVDSLTDGQARSVQPLDKPAAPVVAQPAVAGKE